MILEVPNFINSKYLIIDSEGWHLKEDAPKNLKIEFDKFMKEVNDYGYNNSPN